MAEETKKEEGFFKKVLKSIKDFDKYEDYLMTENRFANLKNVNSDNANMILEEQKKWAMNRFNYYKRISEE